MAAGGGRWRHLAYIAFYFSACCLSAKLVLWHWLVFGRQVSHAHMHRHTHIETETATLTQLYRNMGKRQTMAGNLVIARHLYCMQMCERRRKGGASVEMADVYAIRIRNAPLPCLIKATACIFIFIPEPEPVSVPLSESESQLELKPALQPGHMSSSNKYLCTFVWVCVWWVHVFVVLDSACLHVCVELKKYDILSVKQALCQTNSHWLRYKRGIATLSCLPSWHAHLVAIAVVSSSLPHPFPIPIAITFPELEFEKYIFGGRQNKMKKEKRSTLQKINKNARSIRPLLLWRVLCALEHRRTQTNRNKRAHKQTGARRLLSLSRSHTVLRHSWSA